MVYTTVPVNWPTPQWPWRVRGLVVTGVPVGRSQRPVPGVALSWLYPEGATEVGEEEAE